MNGTLKLHEIEFAEEKTQDHFWEKETEKTEFYKAPFLLLVLITCRIKY